MSATCRAQSARRRRVSASTSGAGAARPGLVDDMAQKSTCPIQKEEYGRRYATQPADKSRLTCWFVIQPTGSARSVAHRCAGRPDTGTSRFIRSRTTLSRSPRQPPLIRSKDGAALTILHRDGSRALVRGGGNLYRVALDGGGHIRSVRRYCAAAQRRGTSPGAAGPRPATSKDK